MVKFTSDVPDDPRGYALPLMRCPTGRPIAAIITSDNQVGCPTHFWGGRTVPCQEENCEPCLEGNPWRWHSYLSAYSPKADDSFLFESTRRVAKMFAAYRQTHGSLRGCHFKAQRRTSARNSRVNMEMKPADLRSIRLPDPPNLIACLAIIWNLKMADLEIADVVDQVPRIHANGQGDQVQPLPNQMPIRFPDEARPKTA